MKNTLSIMMILIISLFLAGCDKDIEFVSTKSPKADAGKDVNITVGDSAELKGTVIAGDGEIVVYEWKEGTELLSDSKQFTYTPRSPEDNHTLTFTVYDSNDKSDSDEMIVFVEAVEANESN
jgi:hypothetical protein